MAGGPVAREAAHAVVAQARPKEQDALLEQRRNRLAHSDVVLCAQEPECQGDWRLK